MSGPRRRRCCASSTSTPRSCALIDRDLGQVALGREDVRRLMSIPGVDATVALSIVAAVGDFTRFRTPEKLVCYFGLNPRVRQSGGQPASHGRITKAGPGHARGMLVEAAWAASKAPGPLRAFYQRVRARRGMQVAAVATARKLTVLCWHLTIKGEDYAFALPSLVAHKRRKLELRAGLPSHRGPKGKAAAYSLKAVRAAERDLAAQGETAYRTMVATWQPTRPASKTRHGRRGRWARPPAMGRDSRAVRLCSAAALPVPVFCSSLGGRPRPPQPEVTAVLAAVKVVPPAGGSTLTAAAGRGLRQLRRARGMAQNSHSRGAAPLTFSSVVRRWIQCSAG